MKFTQSLVLCSFALIASMSILSPAIADTHQQDTAKIKAAYTAFDVAFEKEDADGVVASDAPDFADYDPKGKEIAHSKAEDLANVKIAFGRAKDCSSNSVVTNIVYDKTGATVYVTESISLRLPATIDQDHMLSDHETDREYWVELNGTWLLKITRTLTQTITLDGKPVDE